MSVYRGRRPGDPDYGLGEHTIDADRLGVMDETELTELLVRTFSLPSYRPPRLPVVATEILSLSQDPDVKFSAIEALLEQDAMLAGEVLTVARSAFYSGVRPVTTLQAALVRLGLGKLHDVVLEVAMNLRVFRSPTYRGCMEQLRLHSHATANLARILSRYSPVTQDRAFLCGLLHDAGIAGILLILGDTQRQQRAPDLAPLWPAIDRAHARAGARMVELWRLPPEVATAIAGHHEVRVEGRDDPMAATVCLAEQYAGELGLGLVPDGGGDLAHREDLERSGLAAHGFIDRTTPATLQRARSLLGLDEPMVHRVREEAEAWVAKRAAPAGAASDRA